MKKTNLGYYLFSVGIIAIIAILISLALSLSSCGSAYKARRCAALNCCPIVKDSTRIQIKDSTAIHWVDYETPGDSGYITAYLECNQENQVIMRESEIVNGKYLSLSKQIKDGKFTVYVYSEPIHDSIPCEETYHSESNFNQQVPAPIEVPRKFTRIEKALMISGGTFWLLILVIIVIKIYRLTKKLKATNWLKKLF